MSWLSKLPLAALVLTMACQNNTIELETDPVDDDDMDSGGSMDTGPADDVGGGTAQTLLLAINTPWSDTAFIQALVTSTPSGATTNISMQFLSLDMGSNTAPREPVGEVYDFVGVPVDGQGGFVLDAGQVTIVAAANPINGLDIVTTLVLTAVPQGSPLCGTVTGTVTAPVSAVFDGSTHAMTEVPGIDDLPTTVVAACP